MKVTLRRYSQHLSWVVAVARRVCRFKDQVAYERLVLHAFQLPHVVSAFRTLKDAQPKRSLVAEGPAVRRGRLKTVAGTHMHALNWANLKPI